MPYTINDEEYDVLQQALLLYIAVGRATAEEIDAAMRVSTDLSMQWMRKRPEAMEEVSDVAA